MTRIREATSQGVKAAGKGIFEATLITAGQGSSGYYSNELLKTYGATTFSENRPCFANHSTEADWENGRDLTKIMGKLVSDAEYSEDADGVGRLTAKVKVRPEWVEFVDEYQDVIGLSISVSGEASEQEVDGQKRLVVESFDDTDPYRSVDFVVAAGRGGKVERMLESAKQIEEGGYSVKYNLDEHGKIVLEDAQENLGSPTEKESNMDLEKLVKELSEKFDALAESLRPAETPAIDRAEVVESAIEAGLSKSARTRVLASVEGGIAPEDAIAAEKALKEEYEAEFKESHKVDADGELNGRVNEGATGVRPLSDFKF